MKHICLAGLFLLTPFLLFSQVRYPGSSIATTNNALSVLYNPAGLGMSRGFNVFYLQNQARNRKIESNGAVYAQFLGDWGFGTEWYKLNGKRIKSYHLATALPIDRGLYLGFDYNWFEDKRIFSAGLQFRPIPSLSIGSVWRNKRDLPDSFQWGFGFRPFGSRFTLGIDGKFNSDKKWDEDNQITGFSSIEFLDGMYLNGHYSKDFFGFSFQFNWRFIGYEIYNRFDDKSNHLGGSMATYISTDRMRSYVQIPRKKWVQINLVGEIKEEPRPFGLFWKKPPGIRDVIAKIKKLQKDNEVKGLIIRTKNLSISAAGYEEIRSALKFFGKSGKAVWFYAESYDNLDYYLASVADSVFLNPAGNVNLVGLKIIKRYYKGIFDKLGIVPQYEKIGDFKTFSNQFTEKAMSAAEKQMLESILENLYQNFLESIAGGRNIPKDKLKVLIDKAPYNSQMALKAGLVDKLLYSDQFRDLLERQKIKVVEAKEYFALKDYQYDWKGFFDPTIALIYATGLIVSGENTSAVFLGNLMGSETIAGAIRNARKNSRIKAVVIRIDSPGGDAAASEIIWREVFLTTHGKNKKPVIISMGNTAASGGYMIACAGDTILADALTLTGSIGVVGGKFDFSGLFSKFAVHQQILKKGKNADYYSLFSSYTPEQKEKLKILVEEEYSSFVEKVAQGRRMTPETVDSLGQGRIWTGNQAKQNGLIDLIGDLEKAVKIAKKMAQIPLDREVDIQVFPNYPFKISGLLGSIVGQSGGINIKKIEEIMFLWQNVKESDYLLLMYPYIEIE